MGRGTLSVDNAGVDIRRTRFDERSEPDADGLHEWIYVGYDYELTDGDYSLRARTYDDTPGEISVQTGSHPWGRMPYGDPRFASAIEALLVATTATEVKVFTSNPTGLYESLDLDRMRSEART
jgi:hypothetical protein